MYAVLDKPLQGIITGILLKGIVVAFLISQQSFADEGGLLIGSCSGDCFSYTQPADNLLDKGVYALDPYSGEQIEPYAGRMPGYAALYFPLRAVGISKPAAMQTLVILQCLLLGASVWFLAKFAERISGSRAVFLATFLLYGLSSFVAIWALFILTEAFAVSALAFALYFISRRKSRIDFLYAGLWLGWAVFLRPYLVVLFLPLCIYVMIANRDSIKRGVIAAVLLIAPFFIADAAWIARNYAAKDAFIPLQSGRFAGYQSYADWELAFFDWMLGWGGDAVAWNPKSEAALFYDMTRADAPPLRPEAFDRLPESIYIERVCTKDTVLQLARDIRRLYYELDKASETYQRLEARVISTLERCAQAYRETRRFDYHVAARLRVLKAMLLHSGTYNLFARSFAELPFPLKLVKLAYSALYLFVMFGGLAGGLLLLFLHKSKWEIALFFSIPVGLIALFCFVFRTAEYRHLALVYPLLLVFSVWAFIVIWRKISENKRNAQSQVSSTT